MQTLNISLSSDLVSWINSHPLQNCVKNGAVLGYFGSMARRLNDSEPAFYITSLRAKKDSLKFEVSFMNTNAGRKTKQVVDAGIGGFQLVIHDKTVIGFDYVLKSVKAPVYTSASYGTDMPQLKAKSQAEEDTFFIQLVEIKDAEIERLKHLMRGANQDRLDLTKMVADR
mgnify:CR=1 FL=1